MDGTGGYYAKQNKSVRERQIYDFTHVEFEKHNVVGRVLGGVWAKWAMVLRRALVRMSAGCYM